MPFNPFIVSLSMAQRALRWLVVALFLGTGLAAMSQSEPTLNDIYATAQAGRLDEAQKMISHVLVAHPESAKARYVQSELFARQNKLAQARTSLAAADKLAPGLPFAKPEAVRTLRAQLSAEGPGASPSGATRVPAETRTQTTQAASVGGPGAVAAGSGSGGTPWLIPLLLAVAAIVAGYFIFRRRPPAGPSYGQPDGQANPYRSGAAPGTLMADQGNGLSGPQAFGSAAAGNYPPNNVPPNAYPQNGYPPGAYPPGAAPGYQQPYGQQPQGPGFGRQIAGGVATGLAVGAGVMAAQALARNFSEHHDAGTRPAEGADRFSQGGHDNALSNVNTDMGGNDFGIADGGSWDDAGASDAGGGGSDWDT